MSVKAFLKEIIEALAEIPQLHVTARATSFRLSAITHSIREMGAVLGVANVFEGSVKTDANHIRITAQLIDVNTEYHRWAKAYSGLTDNLFSLYDEIKADVALELGAIVGMTVPPAHHSPRNHDAYLAVLKSRQHTSGVLPEFWATSMLGFPHTRRTTLKRKRFTEEQIVAVLRDAEATTIAAAARKHGVSEPSIHRWRRQFADMEVSDVRELRRVKEECATKEAPCRAGPRSGGDEGDSGKNVVTPRGRRAMAKLAVTRGISQRRSAWLCSTPRSGLYYESRMDRRDRHLAQALSIIARRYPAWGYRLSCGFLRLRGWKVNPKRVYRVWQRIGLSLPLYRPKRKVRTGAKLDGIALRRNDVWAWDFVHDRYHNAETLRCLTIKDEATGYCLAIRVGRHLRSQDVIEQLLLLVTRYGQPRAIRCDNGSEFLANALVAEIERHGIQLANIEPGKPWQNGSNESFNGTFRKECLMPRSLPA